MNAFCQSVSWLRHASGWPQENKKQMLGKHTSPDPEPPSPSCLRKQQSCQEAFRKQTPIPPCDFPPRIFLSPRMILSSPSSYFLLLFWLSLPPLSRRSPSLLLLPRCHSAHLGCLVELGTSVPVRGAQWGPVEDTKGGLLQLPVTLRPAQQLFGVYSSVLNPHTQPYHKGTSLAPAQRSPPLTPS